MRKACQLLLLSLVLTCAAGPAAGKPAIWLASDAESQVWLLGSIHVLKDSIDWHTDTLDAVIDAADYYYYEIPINKEAQAKTAGLLRQRGTNDGGKLLTDFLDEPTTEQLEKVAKSVGLHMWQLRSSSPWLAALLLEAQFLQRAGYTLGAGVDWRMQARTPDDRKRFFETPGQQVAFFNNLSTSVQVGYLKATLQQLQESPDDLQHMVEAWSTGDVERLNTILNSAIQDVDPAVYQALIVRRTAAWARQLRNFINQGNDNALVTVGAAHMVGDEGLPVLLESDSITVSRVQ